MRPVNCVMMGFAVLVGAVLAGSNALSAFWLNLAYGFATGFTLTAASMVINDYYDREIDAINEPTRPIPSGSVQPREALTFASLLTGVGFVTAYLTNTTSILSLTIAVLSWVISVTYVTAGKRTGLLGNFLVSTCVAVPFIYGSVAVLNTVALNVLIFASMAFLSNTGREITKGIVDVEGDKVMHIQTVAARYGGRAAVDVATLFYLSAVALSPIPWLLNLVNFWFIPFVAITDFGIITSAFLLLRDYRRENAKKVKNMILLWFVFGLFAFILGAA